MKKTYGVLRGGIGNQLFQLAAFSELASRSNRELVLDLNSYKHSSQKKLGRKPDVLQLKCFQSIKTMAWGSDWMVVPTTLFHQVVRTASDLIFSDSAPFGLYASEKGKQSLKSFEQQSTFRYLDAYFVDLKSIENFSESIDLVTEHLLLEAASRGLDKLPSHFDAALHVRMGDLLTLEPSKVLSKARIISGIKKLNLDLDGRFMLFSDSPELASGIVSEIGLDYTLAPPGLSDLEALMLMGCSKNLICSSSTFSWWAGNMVRKSGGGVAFPAHNSDLAQMHQTSS